MGLKTTPYERSWAYTKEEVASFMNTPNVADQIGIDFAWRIPEEKVRAILPPHLEYFDNIAVGYLRQLRAAEFASPYNELCIAILAKYGDLIGPYAVTLMLHGPGTECGQICGAELAPIPKKLADDIVIDRFGNEVFAYVIRHGEKIFDIGIDLGKPCNDEQMGPALLGDGSNVGKMTDGVQMYHRHALYQTEDGSVKASHVQLCGLTVSTKVSQFEPGRITKLEVHSTPDDPYGELAMEAPIGADWAITETCIMKEARVLADLDPVATLPYLLPCFYDSALFGKKTVRLGF